LKAATLVSRYTSVVGWRTALVKRRALEDKEIAVFGNTENAKLIDAAHHADVEVVCDDKFCNSRGKK